MFDGQNHLLALATVMGTLGGFQNQPKWFAALSKYSLWQILMGTVLVYQGGGGQNFWYSLSVSLVFFIVVAISNQIFFTQEDGGTHLLIAKSQPVTDENSAQAPPETFFTGY